MVNNELCLESCQRAHVPDCERESKEENKNLENGKAECKKLKHGKNQRDERHSRERVKACVLYEKNASCGNCQQKQ